MAKNYSAKNKKTGRESRVNWFILPLLFTIAIVPLVVRAHLFDTWLAGYDFFSTEEQAVDFFLASKMWTFVGISAVMACLLVYKLIREGRKIKFSMTFIPLFAYALLAILSSVFSEYSYFCYMGINEQFESLFALLGYVLVAYYAFIVVNEEKDVAMVLWFLAGSTAIILMIGASQAWFTDIFKTDFAQNFILTDFLRQNGHFEFAFEEGRVYLTLYNPNYVGSYASLLVPFFLMSVFYAKRVWQKAACGVLAVGVLMALVGSLSKAGFIGVVMALLLILVLFIRELKRFWFPITAVAIIVIGTLYTMNNYSNGALLNRFVNAFKVTESEKKLQGIDTLDDEIVIHYAGEELHISAGVDKSNLSLRASAKDGQGNPVYFKQLPENEYYYGIDDERFDDMTIGVTMFSQDIFGFVMNIDGAEWYFTNEVKDGTYYYFTKYAKFVKMHDSPSAEWLLEHGRMASGRGFIWSKTLPVLADHIFLGSGADTFQIVFPNTDYVSLHNYGYLGQIITKPHNMYLQIGVQTGVLSLICILAFYILYFIRSFRIYFKGKGPKIRFVGMGIFAGTFGYMVVAVINDSTITVAPLFWALIGVGMAINEIVAKETGEELKVDEVAEVSK